MSDQIKIGRRTFLKGSAAASALLTLAACKKEDGSAAGGDATAQAASGGATVNYYINNPVSIDPFNVQEDQGTQVCYQLFDSLTDYDYNAGEVVCKACTSYDANDDATQFTFHLVEGAKFHNGDPVNAEAFVRGWTRLVDPKTTDAPSDVSYHISMVKGYDELVAGTTTEFAGLSAPDENTFVVELKEPYADFPYVATHPALAPVPQAALDDYQTYFLSPIGNGAFKMDGKWEDGQYINLVRNDDYYGDKPSIAGINFNIQKDVETAYREFQAGNLDFCDIPTAQIDEAKSTYGESEDGYTVTPGAQALFGEEPSLYYLTVNNTDETMKDINLRRAISLAINRQSICDNIFMGVRAPADNMIPPGIAGYEEGVWEYAHYDKDAAVKLLDEHYPADANGRRGVSITLSFSSDGSHKEIMEHVQADLDAVGLDVTLDSSEWAAYLDQLQNLEYQIGRLGWIADYPIMDNFLYPMFYTGNGDNRSGFSDPEVDEALLAARQTVDDDERIANLQAVNKQISEAFPVIPLLFYKHNFVGGERIQEAYMDPAKKCHFESMTVTE